ncbi:uncharacterized protein LOC113758321 [Coffea eugenioides]|uniref:uncharacterized protein LOC113758321 n=1 Tax=Coffea eugenioides TaxID=49369 RepID=UPI000F60E54D|nr:uncharacterized protein LOC113758321 [Coffea eugenioides]
MVSAQGERVAELEEVIEGEVATSAVVNEELRSTRAQLTRLREEVRSRASDIVADATRLVDEAMGAEVDELRQMVSAQGERVAELEEVIEGEVATSAVVNEELRSTRAQLTRLREEVRSRASDIVADATRLVDEAMGAEVDELRQMVSAQGERVAELEEVIEGEVATSAVVNEELRSTRAQLTRLREEVRSRASDIVADATRLVDEAMGGKTKDIEQTNQTADYTLMFNAMKSELKWISEQQMEEMHNRFDELSKSFTRGSRSRSHNRNHHGTKGANYEDYSASDDEERAERPKRDTTKDALKGLKIKIPTFQGPLQSPLKRLLSSGVGTLSGSNAKDSDISNLNVRIKGSCSLLTIEKSYLMITIVKRCPDSPRRKANETQPRKNVRQSRVKLVAWSGEEC